MASVILINKATPTTLLGHPRPYINAIFTHKGNSRPTNHNINRGDHAIHVKLCHKAHDGKCMVEHEGSVVDNPNIQI